MKKLTRLGVAIILVGISLLLVTVLRGGSPDGPFSFTGGELAANAWSNYLNAWLCSPRDLTVGVQANATIDMYIVKAGGYGLWEVNETLKPLWTFRGIKQETFTIQPGNRDVCSILIHNPSSVAATVKATITFSGLERDLLWSSFAFIIVGFTVIIFSVAVNIFRKRSVEK